jgi:hypothetical protein
LCRVILLSTFGLAKYEGMKVNCLHIIFVLGLQFIGVFWLVYHGRQVCCLLCPPTPGYSKSHKDLQGVVKNGNSYVWTWVYTFQGFKISWHFVWWVCHLSNVLVKLGPQGEIECREGLWLLLFSSHYCKTKCFSHVILQYGFCSGGASSSRFLRWRWIRARYKCDPTFQILKSTENPGICLGC